MMQHPARAQMKFSILTPAFNAAPYIGKCIDSVAAQNIADVEHIIFDGNSKDSTAEILKQNSHRLAFWKSEPDKGQSDALNKALDRATGEIVGWLNADEYYEPNIFKLVHAAFEKNPNAVVVYGNYNRVTETGKRIRTTKSWRFDYDVCSIQTPIIMNCAAFFRADALRACGGFARDLRYIMDWDLYPGSWPAKIKTTGSASARPSPTSPCTPNQRASTKSPDSSMKSRRSACASFPI
jgi:glycosyltransferase involved in cell wall biosynthesis